MKRILPVLLLACVFALAGCEADEPDTDEADEPIDAEVAAATHDGFWENMREHCGNAYRGGLTREPEGDEMLEGDEELIVHFRQCDDDELRLPFHIEEDEDQWDRSRTWVFIRHEDQIELRHDHRHEDGTEEEDSWYGAYTQTEGSQNQQEFILEDRRADDGSQLGWRVIIEPNERYTYGTIRGNEYTWRVDFDLTETVETPPAPWGHEDTEAYQ